MSENSSAAIPAAEADEPVSLKSFLLTAVLWLPLAFLLWFLLRSVVAYPVIQAAKAWLMWWMPELVRGVEQDLDVSKIGQVPIMLIITALRATGMAPDASGNIPVFTPDVSPLEYCYGLPLLLGLIMATPLSWGQTFRQLLLGYLVLLPVQTFGVVGAALKTLSYDIGKVGMDAVAVHGVSQYVVAIWFQFGSLILPPLVPVVLWILMNRRFIEGLSGPLSARQEPPADSGGHRS